MSNELMQEAFNKMQTEIKQAQRYIQQGELIKAEAIYHDMLKLEQNYPPALHGLAELAGKINDLDVREDLLRRAINEIKGSQDRNIKSLAASWLTELAEVLMKQNRQDDARACISESKRIITDNLTGD